MKIIFKSFLIFAVNMAVVFFVAFGKLADKWHIATLFSPVLVGYLVSRNVFKQSDNKQKSLVFIFLAAIVMLLVGVFYIIERFFLLRDDFGIYMMFFLPTVFNVIPNLLFALMYFLKHLCHLRTEKESDR